MRFLLMSRYAERRPRADQAVSRETTSPSHGDDT